MRDIWNLPGQVVSDYRLSGQEVEREQGPRGWSNQWEKLILSSQGLTVYSWPAWDYGVRLACLCLLSAGIKGVPSLCAPCPVVLPNITEKRSLSAANCTFTFYEIQNVELVV